VRLIYGCDEAIAEYVYDHIPKLRGRGFGTHFKAIGVGNNSGEIVGGFVYSGYDPEAGILEISCASSSKKWLTRDVLNGLFAYPFEDCACQMVFNRFSATDTALYRMCEAIGFKIQTVPRLYGRGHDAFVGTLTIEDWHSSRFFTARQS
jgi:RimJ/RimL family protein N-acetyltransferase